MSTTRNLVRIALEMEDSDVQEMQRIIEEYNAVCSPLKLNRTELIRVAVKEKVEGMRRQLEKIQRA